jgi:hypothetical protein
MVKKLQNPFLNSKYENLKYRVLEIYDSLNREEKLKFKEYLSALYYGMSEVTVYNYMNLTILNEDNTPNRTEIPFPILYFIARIFGFENPVELFNPKYKETFGEVYTMPKFDKSFTESLQKRHNIRVPQAANA